MSRNFDVLDPLGFRSDPPPDRRSSTVVLAPTWNRRAVTALLDDDDLPGLVHPTITATERIECTAADDLFAVPFDGVVGDDRWTRAHHLHARALWGPSSTDEAVAEPSVASTRPSISAAPARARGRVRARTRLLVPVVAAATAVSSVLATGVTGAAARPSQTTYVVYLVASDRVTQVEVSRPIREPVQDPAVAAFDALKDPAPTFYGTLLAGSADTVVRSLDSDRAEVALGRRYAAAPDAARVRIVAQIVLTLHAYGVNAVSFVEAGTGAVTTVPYDADGHTAALVTPADVSWLETQDFLYAPAPRDVR